MRTIVDLPEEQISALGVLCAQENISRAEAVRRAVDVLLAQNTSPAREAAFGGWKDQTDSRQMVDKLREEWSV